MINCNDSVFKNNYFFTNVKGLGNDNSFYTKKRHKKEFKEGVTVADIQKTIKEWDNYTFKDIRDILIYEGDGTDVSCNLDGTLKPKFKIDIDDGSVSTDTEGVEVDENEVILKNWLKKINSLKVDAKYIFKLSDDSQIEFTVNNNDSNYFGFEIDGVDGTLGLRYKEFLDNNFEFRKKIDNIEMNPDESKSINLKTSVYLGGENEDGGTNDKDISIDEIVNIVDDGVSNGGDNDDDDLVDISDDELEDYFKEFISSNKAIRNALWKKPNKFLGAFNLAKERGLLPADDRLGVWANIANKNKLYEFFRPGEVVSFSFTNIIKLKDEESIQFSENKDYSGYVLKTEKGRQNTLLKTNFTKTTRKGELDYIVKVIQEVQDYGEYKLFEVEVFKNKNTKDKNKIAKGKIKSKKNKQEIKNK